MFDYLKKAADQVEALLNEPSLTAALPLLRARIGIDDFGLLLGSMPLDGYPMLSQALPPMASVEVQTSWTGNSGYPLLKQSCAFVRSAAFTFTAVTGSSLNGARILDYGCGYGRLARLMWYFTDPDRLFGIDPWHRSIDICREDRLGDNFRLSDYLPEVLPVHGKFDLIYAFSVYTHLSETATRQALKVSRDSISDDGILFITIRPIEYWSLDKTIHGLDDTSSQREAHDRDGFAFQKLDFEGGHYGNTSMTTDWLATNFPAWQVASIDRSLEDAYQVYVALRPR